MIIYLFGQPGSGKTTLGKLLQRTFFGAGHTTLRLDGDELRDLTMNVDYSVYGRYENLQLAHLIASTVDATPNLQGRPRLVICSFVSPYRELRQHIYDNADVLMVYLHTTRALPHDRKLVSNFEPPEGDYLDVNTDANLEMCAEKIITEMAVRLGNRQMNYEKRGDL